MCGINGMIGSHQNVVRTMNAAIAHRGPDDTGVLAGSDATIGNNRLAIIDLSTEGHQPMTRGGFSIVYNGELYNYKEIRSELAAAGVTCTSDSDTEVILQGYATWGAAITKKMRGMWSFAVLDSKRRTLFLSRDPFGIKPLYIYDDGKTLAFSSEIRGLLANPSVEARVDPQSLRDIITIGFALAPRTIISNVRAFLPGEEVLIDLPSRKQMSTINELEARTEQATSDDELESVLRDSMQHHLIADVPVGLFFSGGTDSSLIAALLHDMGVHLNAYHVSVPGREDTMYAEKIAHHLGLPLSIVRLEDETSDELINQAIAALDEPIADTSFIPTYLVSRRASENVKVVLSGEGGDELFGGYARHTSLMKMPLTAGIPLHPPVSSLIRRYPQSVSRSAALQGASRRMHSLAGNAFGRFIDEIGFGAPLADTRSVEREMHSRVSHYQTPDGTLSLDRLMYLPDVNLLKIDTATMAHSIEGRVPLLDREVWRVVGGQPNDWKSNSTVMKAPIKRILSKYLPSELVHRPKSGFSSSVGTYFKGEGQQRLDSALAWYSHEYRGLLPALDSILSDMPAHGELFRKHLGYSLYGLMVVHSWAKLNKVR